MPVAVRIGEEGLVACFGAEVEGASVVLLAGGRFFGPDLHAANRVQDGLSHDGHLPVGGIRAHHGLAGRNPSAQQLLGDGGS